MFECPSRDFSCPYFKSGICLMGKQALEECDEAMYYYDGDDEDVE